MIAVRELTVRYRGAARDALASVTVDAPASRVTAVVGPNGSGKSTLVRALLGRVPIAAGRILIDGDDAHTLARDEIARRIAVVTQREELAFPLRVDEYVALGRHPRRRAERRPGDVAAALARADATALAARSVHALSGGEWQRVRIARALVQGGDTLVLDEPTTFLDVAHEMSAFELLHDLAREGRAVLLVSHQLNLVARFADALVLLHDGRVAAAGAPADVMQPAVLEMVYEWPLVVTRDPAIGAPALIPLRGGSRRGQPMHKRS